MRFKRMNIRVKNRGEPSERRIRSAERYIQKQKDKYPLFPDLYCNDARERVMKMDSLHDDWIRKFRKDAARRWRNARKVLRDMPEKRRVLVLKWWNEYSGCPAGDDYFADLLFSVESGIRDLEEEMRVRDSLKEMGRKRFGVKDCQAGGVQGGVGNE